jgi:hypothetical protein
MKFCKDCIYHETTLNWKTFSQFEHFCSIGDNTNPDMYNLVTGHYIGKKITCDESRKDPSKCGKEGKFFQSIHI